MQRRITPKFLSSGEHKKKLFVGYKTALKLFFCSIYSRVFTKITQSYSFRSIYPRVRTKIIPNNFKFIIINPTQRTSKSAPRFLLEKQRQECASTPMHRLTQCHHGNSWLECHNIFQVKQYDTHCHHEYSFARHISSALKSIKVFNSIKRNLKGKTQFITR